MAEKKRKIPGTNVYIIGAVGTAVLGKIRLVTARGVEITEQVNHSVKVTLQKQVDNIIGKVILSDEDGVPLPLIETLLNGLKIIGAVKVQTKTVSCPSRPAQIDGIVTGSGYTAGDALGTLTRVKVPKSGVIMSGTWWDFDNEGTQVDLEIFKDKVIQIPDHDTFSPTDFDMLPFVMELSFFAFDDHTNVQTSEVMNIGKAYTCPKGYFYIQAVDRSTQNIAAGSEPRFQLQILSDDPTWKER